MRVAVTGSTGFVGGAVVRHLAARGDAVFAFGRRATHPFACLSNVTYRQWDIAIAPLHDAPDVDAAVHCAGAVAAWGADETFYRANVTGTRHVMDSFPASRFVHLSSASVYDPCGDAEGLREDAPYPQTYLNAYGRTKMLAERVLLDAGRRCAILRPRAVYGPGDTTLLPRLLRAFRGGQLFAIGPGSNRLSITAIDNLLHAVDRALAYDGPGRVFNVADAAPVTLDELLAALLRAMGREPRLVHLPVGPVWGVAAALERVAALVGDAWEPPLTRYVAAQMSRTCTLDLSRSVAELGYHPAATYRDVLPRLCL